jgi:hypothetical protein
LQGKLFFAYDFYCFLTSAGASAGASSAAASSVAASSATASSAAASTTGSAAGGASGSEGATGFRGHFSGTSVFKNSKRPSFSIAN